MANRKALVLGALSFLEIGAGTGGGTDYLDVGPNGILGNAATVSMDAAGGAGVDKTIVIGSQGATAAGNVIHLFGTASATVGTLQIHGDLAVDGAENITGTSTFEDDATFKGNVTFGDPALPNPDTITFAADTRIISDMLYGAVTGGGGSRALRVDTSAATQLATDLTLQAGVGGAGSNDVGGDVLIVPGAPEGTGTSYGSVYFGNQGAVGDADGYQFLANTPDATKPGLRWNDATSIWEYRNDSGTWNPLVSGGGVLPVGTIVFQHLRWNGAAWVTEDDLRMPAGADRILDIDVSTGAAHSLTVTAGAAAAGSFAGGSVTVSGTASTGTEDAGGVSVYGGAAPGTGFGGTVTIVAGGSSGGTGGSVNIDAGGGESDGQVRIGMNVYGSALNVQIGDHSSGLAVLQVNAQAVDTATALGTFTFGNGTQTGNLAFQSTTGQVSTHLPFTAIDGGTRRIFIRDSVAPDDGGSLELLAGGGVIGGDLRLYAASGTTGTPGNVYLSAGSNTAADLGTVFFRRDDSFGTYVDFVPAAGTRIVSSLPFLHTNGGTYQIYLPDTTPVETDGAGFAVVAATGGSSAVAGAGQGGGVGITAGAGGAITGASAAGAGAGGSIDIDAGDGGAEAAAGTGGAGNGGQLQARAGSGGDTLSAESGGKGGQASVYAGDGGDSATGSGGPGGDLYLGSGDGGTGGGGNGSAGDVKIQGGQAVGVGGDVEIRSGAANVAGAIQLFAGASDGTPVNHRDIDIRAGTYTAGTENGHIVIGAETTRWIHIGLDGRGTGPSSDIGVKVDLEAASGDGNVLLLGKVSLDYPGFIIPANGFVSDLRFVGSVDRALFINNNVAATDGPTLTIRPGITNNAAAGIGGDIEIQATDGTTTGAGGDVNITAGGTATGAGGDVRLLTGALTGVGTYGNVYFGYNGAAGAVDAYQLLANTGEAAQAGLRYDDLNNKWQYRNDNTAWTDFVGGGGVLPAGTNVGDHLEWNGATWSALPDISLPSNGSRTINVRQSASGEGQSLTVQAGMSGTAGDLGGILYLRAGAPGISGPGSAVRIHASDAVTSGMGGSVSLYSGSSPNNRAGSIDLICAAGFAAGGGNINLTSGDGTGVAAGNINLTGGESTTAAGGSIYINGGDGATTGQVHLGSFTTSLVVFGGDENTFVDFSPVDESYGSGTRIVSDMIFRGNDENPVKIGVETAPTGEDGYALSCFGGNGFSDDTSATNGGASQVSGGSGGFTSGGTGNSGSGGGALLIGGDGGSNGGTGNGGDGGTVTMRAGTGTDAGVAGNGDGGDGGRLYLTLGKGGSGAGTGADGVDGWAIVGNSLMGVTPLLFQSSDATAPVPNTGPGFRYNNVTGTMQFHNLAGGWTEFGTGTSIAPGTIDYQHVRWDTSTTTWVAEGGTSTTDGITLPSATSAQEIKPTTAAINTGGTMLVVRGGAAGASASGTAKSGGDAGLIGGVGTAATAALPGGFGGQTGVIGGAGGIGSAAHDAGNGGAVTIMGGIAGANGGGGGGSGGDVNITGGTGTGGIGGGSILIDGGNGGGNVVINGGVETDAGISGNVELNTQDAGATVGVIAILTGSGTGAATAGGALVLGTGDGTGSEPGGYFELTIGGNATGGDGGYMQFVAGNALGTGAGGAATFSAGGANSGAGGDVTISAGNSNSGTTGDVFIRGGSGLTNGVVYLGDTNTSLVQFGDTSATQIDFEGHADNRIINGITFYSEADHIIQIATSTTNGHLLNIHAGNGATAAGGTGGAMTIGGGNAGITALGGAFVAGGGNGGVAAVASIGGFGGTASMQGGSGGDGDVGGTLQAGNGGVAYLTGGTAGADTGGGGGFGGVVQITGGQATGTNAGATVFVTGGQGGSGGGNGGDVRLWGGASTGGSSGDITLGDNQTTRVYLGDKTNGIQYDISSTTLTSIGTGIINLKVNPLQRTQIDGTLLSTNFTAANANTLVDNGNATGLHYHTATGTMPASFLAIVESGVTTSAGEVVAVKPNGANAPRAYQADADNTDQTQYVQGLALATVVGNGVLQVTIITSGEVATPNAAWVSIPAVTDVGKPCYLSGTAGLLTLTAPTSSGQTRTKVGYVTSGGTGAVKVNVQVGDPIAIA